MSSDFFNDSSLYSVNQIQETYNYQRIQHSNNKFINEYYAMRPR